MTKAPRPENEGERLVRLHSYRILDTKPEEEYERIVELARHIAETPTAFISFVDEERQWFKAKRGFAVDSTSRGDSFCQHVVARGEAIEVSDASGDERFCDNPLVTGEVAELRFYRGTPLLAQDGSVVGSLCVTDFRPRTLSDEQKTMLDHLAATVVELLESRLAAHRLAQSESLVRQLHGASTVGKPDARNDLHEFLEIGKEQFGMEIGVFCKFDGNDHQILALSAPDDIDYLPEDFIFSDESLAVRVRASEEIFVLPVVPESTSDSAPPEEKGWRSVVSCPLFDEGEYSGSITFASRSRMKSEFTSADAERLRLMGVWLSTELHRRSVERERSRLVEELTLKVKELETLHGLLPICSYCKQIRDEEGQWQEIETFVADRSGADFSHGICPGCFETNIVSEAG